MTARMEPRWLWTVAAVAWLVCLIHLGNRIGAPYWLDEFSTLWVIEDGLVGVVERTFQVQGQSPLYYALVVPIRELVELHPWILRLPSLLLVGAAVPIAVVAGLAVFRINVITEHHIAYAYVPVALLAGVALDDAWRERGLTRPLVVAAAVVAAVHVVAGCLAVDRLFHRFGYQDWPAAIAVIEAEQERLPGPVCLRSGFSEQDRVISAPQWVDRYQGFFLASLRSPGRRPPHWRVLLLNYRWRHPGRAAYLGETILPVLRQEISFYYLSSRFWSYGEEFRRYVEITLPAFEARLLPTSPGLEAWVFVRVNSSPR